MLQEKIERPSTKPGDASQTFAPLQPETSTTAPASPQASTSASPTEEHTTKPSNKDIFNSAQNGTEGANGSATVNDKQADVSTTFSALHNGKVFHARKFRIDVKNVCIEDLSLAVVKNAKDKVRNGINSVKACQRHRRSGSTSAPLHISATAGNEQVTFFFPFLFVWFMDLLHYFQNN